jgi:hypothetical protein
MTDGMIFKRAQCEYLRNQAKNFFDKVRFTWLESMRWALPHRATWMLSQTEGQRNNQHIVDSTHIIAHRGFVAGFQEGNTSASRPWYRCLGQDPELNLVPANKLWLEKFTSRTQIVLSTSNFYNANGTLYGDYAVVNTGSYFIDELPKGLFFHVLIPGSYFVINDAYGNAVVLVREISLTVKALVDQYGRKDASGNWDWSNFSTRVKTMYNNGIYTQMVDIVQVVKENEHFDPSRPQVLLNKQWVSLTYELGGLGGQYYQEGQDFATDTVNPEDSDNREVFLKVSTFRRKPFIIATSEKNGNFEYGEKGPTTDSMGLIKSLNKKAIGKDQALEHMLRPPMQGPANLRKSYITTAANAYVPLDPSSAKPGGGLRSIFEINPAIQGIIQDVDDLREMVNKLYYSDYFMYLSRNPKTRTATETTAVVHEQQMVIGPTLQALNWSHNLPLVEFLMDYVLYEDPFLPPPPPGLAGQFMRTEFISVFAQALKAADLPAVNQYMAMIEQVSQVPGMQKITDKVNVDKLADIFEDRLYLPSGLNNPQGKVDAMRQQAQMQQQRQQLLEQTLPAVAGAAKDAGMTAKQ